MCRDYTVVLCGKLGEEVAAEISAEFAVVTTRDVEYIIDCVGYFVDER